MGLPLAMEFAEAGLNVVGVEKAPNKLSALRAGESYVEDVASERLAPLVSSGAVRATDDYSALSEVDAVIICLPTPLDENREPDLSMLVAGARETARNIGPGTLVVLESRQRIATSTSTRPSTIAVVNEVDPPPQGSPRSIVPGGCGTPGTLLHDAEMRRGPISLHNALVLSLSSEAWNLDSRGSDNRSTLRDRCGSESKWFCRGLCGSLGGPASRSPRPRTYLSSRRG